MTVININTVPNEGLPGLLSGFRGVDPAKAERLSTLLTGRSPVEDTEQLPELFEEAGIDPSFHEGLLSWFYAWADPCDCWHAANVNDIPGWETTARFGVLGGIDAGTAERLEEIRTSMPRPQNFEGFSVQLAEAGVTGEVIEWLSTWMVAEIDDVTNAVNDAERWAELAEVPVLVAVDPPTAAPGDTLRLEVRHLSDHRPTWVEINGYPAETLTLSPAMNLVECRVPDEVGDEGEIEVFLDGMPGPVSIGLTIRPRLVQEDCPESWDTRIVALGSTLPVLIDVERPDPFSDELTTETLETQYFCGTNSVILRGGGAASPLPVSYSLAGVLDQTLLGLTAVTPLLASLNTVQLIGRKEKDASGKERTVYYFFRDGKWWRIRDPERKHPDDPNGIDVRDGIPDPNFVEADAATAEELRKMFFPTGWEEKWSEFEETNRVQMQLMWAIGWQMAGGDAESAKIVFDIRKALDGGKPWSEIIEENWRGIVFGILLGAAVGKAGKILAPFRRFFRRFFPELIDRITDVVKHGDDITIMTKREVLNGNSSALGKKVGGKGVFAIITGRVDRARKTLYCTPTDLPWKNQTGREGFARDIYENWVEKLKAFAREKNLRHVEIEAETISDQGRAMAEKLGYQIVSESTVDGITRTKWRKLYPVD